MACAPAFTWARKAENVEYTSPDQTAAPKRWLPAQAEALESWVRGQAPAGIWWTLKMAFLTVAGGGSGFVAVGVEEQPATPSAAATRATM